MSQHPSPDDDFISRLLAYPLDSDGHRLRNRDSSSTITPASPPIPLITQPQGPSIDEVLFELDELVTKWERATENDDNESVIQALEE